MEDSQFWHRWAIFLDIFSIMQLYQSLEFDIDFFLFLSTPSNCWPNSTSAHLESCTKEATVGHRASSGRRFCSGQGQWSKCGLIFELSKNWHNVKASLNLLSIPTFDPYGLPIRKGFTGNDAACNPACFHYYPNKPHYLCCSLLMLF